MSSGCWLRLWRAVNLKKLSSRMKMTVLWTVAILNIELLKNNWVLTKNRRRNLRYKKLFSLPLAQHAHYNFGGPSGIRCTIWKGVRGRHHRILTPSWRGNWRQERPKSHRGQSKQQWRWRAVVKAVSNTPEVRGGGCRSAAKEWLQMSQGQSELNSFHFGVIYLVVLCTLCRFSTLCRDTFVTHV